jgi:hypothetical protein
MKVRAVLSTVSGYEFVMNCEMGICYGHEGSGFATRWELDFPDPVRPAPKFIQPAI